MSVHVHGPAYVRPDDRGRCRHYEIAFGCLLQCDSPVVAGTLTCLAHWVSEQLALTVTEAHQLIRTAAQHHAQEQTT